MEERCWRGLKEQGEETYVFAVCSGEEGREREKVSLIHCQVLKQPSSHRKKKCHTLRHSLEESAP